MAKEHLERWHALLAERAVERLGDLLAEDAVFHSPVVHTPQRGKELVTLYLTAAFQVLVNSSFTYVREVVGERDAVLEFTATVDGIHINGVDMIHWNEAGEIDDFKVMIRPLKAIQFMHDLMRRMLADMAPSAPGNA